MDLATISRLACASTGVAMQLHIADATRDAMAALMLDLERARMTSEDLRNGGGPNTDFMHWPAYQDALSQRMQHEGYRRNVRQPRGTTRDFELQTRATIGRAAHVVQVLAHLLRGSAIATAEEAFQATFRVFEEEGWDLDDVQGVADDVRLAVHLALHDTPSEGSEGEEEG